MTASASPRRIIDCDIHQTLPSAKVLHPYLPRHHREELEHTGLRLKTSGFYASGGKVGGGRIDARPPSGGPSGSELEFMQEHHLDALNVEYGILLGQEIRPIPALPDADHAAALAAAYNDWMIEHWIEKDERLKGAAIVPLQEPSLAAKEIRRVGSHPGIVGILAPGGARAPYGQRFYDPVFEACAELDLPFVIHTGSEGGGTFGQPTPVGYPSYYIELRQVRSMSFQAHISSMIFEGLFDRYPTTRVAFVEGGYTWLPTFLWRLDSEWRMLRYQTPWVTRPPSEYVYEHIRFTSQPMETPDRPRQLLTIFEWAHAETTLMFASDYPHFDFDSPELSLPHMPDEMSRRVFTENAREFYKLPVREPAAAAADD